MIRNKHILVAVLNWGLGHATRSIPIIQKLVDNQNNVTLASDGAAFVLLKSVFPNLTLVELPAYNVRYPSRSMVWNIGTQVFKIRDAIRSEHAVIERWTKNNKVDIIISDNRYGCYNSNAENIFVSHQLNLQVPLAGIINRIHASMVNKFDRLWIVDDSNRTLSGKLSDSKWISNEINISYLGPQSRLSKTYGEKKYDIAAVLSGPEPQRTFLERELIEKLTKINLRSILIQGTKSAKPILSNDKIEIIPFANAELLSKIICTSEMMICRSGYSTIMDLAKLGGEALFIPTPGQTEQHYLAKRLADQQMAQFQIQGKIDLEKAWSKRINYGGF